jgi:hypothetical protein
MLRLTSEHYLKRAGTDRNRAAYFRIQAIYEFCPLIA